MKTTATAEQLVLESPFRVESVSPAAAPDGSDGPWHRYVITQGSDERNTITGLRAGTRIEVDAQLKGMVDQLNERYSRLQAKLAKR
jgi:hypothetical protein